MAENRTYASRPAWQWIAIYLVIGAVVYGLVYYFFIARRSSGSVSQPSVQQNSSGVY